MMKVVRKLGRILISIYLLWSVSACQANAVTNPSSTQVNIEMQSTTTIEEEESVLSNVGSVNLTNEETTFPADLEVIQAGNLNRLKLLGRYGLDTFAYHGQMLLSPDGRILAIACYGGVAFYDASNGQPVHFIPTEDEVRSLTFSHDGKSLAFVTLPAKEGDKPQDYLNSSAVFQPVVNLISLVDYQLTAQWTFTGKGCGEFRVQDLLFTPDDRFLFFYDSFKLNDDLNGSICVLEIPGGKLVNQIEPGQPWRVDKTTPLLKDQTSIWALEEDSSKTETHHIRPFRLRHYALGSGQILQEVEIPYEEAGSLLLTPDSQELILVSKTESSWHVRSAVDGQLLKNHSLPLELDGRGIISAAALSPDGKLLGLGFWDGSSAILRYPEGTLVSESPGLVLPDLSDPNSPERADSLHTLRIQFSANNEHLFAFLGTAPNGIIRAVDAADGSELYRISDRGMLDQQPSLSPNGESLVWGGYSTGQIVVWPIGQTEPSFVMQNKSQTVLRTVFSPDGLQLAAASIDGWISVWNMADGVLLNKWQAPEGDGIIWQIAYSHSGNQLASISDGGNVHLWTIDGKLLKSLETGTGSRQVNHLIFSTDDQALWVASGCLYVNICRDRGAGDLRLLDLTNGEMTILFDHPVSYLGMSTDQKLIGMSNGVDAISAEVVSEHNLEVRNTYLSPFSHWNAGSAVSPDGNLLVGGTYYGLHIWDTHTGQLLGLDKLSTPNKTMGGNILFSRDGKLIVVASSNPNIIYAWGVPKE